MDTPLSSPSLERARRFVRDAMQGIFTEFCIHCGERIADRDFFCAACAPRVDAPTNFGFGDTYRQIYTFLYKDALRDLFQSAKFSSRRRAKNFFKRAAYPQLAALRTPGSVFLALPSRSSFLRELLQYCISSAMLRLDAFEINEAPGTGSANKNLGEAARFRRLQECLQLRSVDFGDASNYVLCDDVSTTGATLRQAAHLLEERFGAKREQITLWSLMYRPREFERSVLP